MLEMTVREEKCKGKADCVFPFRPPVLPRVVKLLCQETGRQGGAEHCTVASGAGTNLTVGAGAAIS